MAEYLLDVIPFTGPPIINSSPFRTRRQSRPSPHFSGGRPGTVAPPTITAQCAAATTGTVGSPYSSAITVSGGTGPYTFTLNSGALLPGLTLNASDMKAI